MTLKPAKIFLVGDSHVESVDHAQRAHIRKNLPFEIVLLRKEKVKDGQYRGNSPQKIHEALSEARPDDLVIAAGGGNAHVALSIKKHTIPFDFIYDDKKSGGYDPNATLIPYEVLRAIYVDHMKNEYHTWEQIRSGWSGPIFELTPPPPAEDNLFLAQNAERSFQKNGLKLENLNPPQFRMKMWKMHVHLLKSICENKNILMIFPPKEALTDEGFLKPEAYRDATHANAWYGAFVIDQLIELDTRKNHLDFAYIVQS